MLFEHPFEHDRECDRSTPVGAKPVQFSIIFNSYNWDQHTSASINTVEEQPFHMLKSDFLSLGKIRRRVGGELI